MIGWDIFDFSSETAERDTKKFDRKQDLNIFYQVVFFSLMSKLKLLPWPICQKGGTLYSGARYVALWASCLCLCTYLGKGRGIALMHVYVLEHKVSPYYRTAWRMFMKLGRDEVLMAPHMR